MTKIKAISYKSQVKCMRYSPKQYAVALFESLSSFAKASEDKREALLKRFAEIVVANHDKSQLPKILRHFKLLERRLDGKHGVELITATEPSQGLIKEIVSKLGEHTDIQTKVDSSVLGGVKLIIDDETVIDGTFKSRVEQLVRGMLTQI